MPHKATCLNCGAPFETARPKGTVFQCGSTCRTEWNNRRAQRGAELYDLMMAVRYERDVATEQALWSKACALMASFKADDDKARGGRRSWQDHKAVTERKPYVYANVATGQRDKARARKVESARVKACTARDAAIRASLPI